MKKTDSFYHQGKKLLLSSIAASAIGALWLVPKSVKADSTSNNETIVKIDDIKNEESNEELNEQNSDLTNSVTTEKDITNVNSDNTSNNDILKKGVTSNSTKKTAYWCGLKVSYDTVEKTLTIPGSNGNKVNDAGPINGNIGGVDTTEIEKIIFNNELKLSGEPFGIFSGLTNLKTIENLKYLDTSDVTNMKYMFARCEQLTSLDVSTFDTSQVKNMSYMFHDCKNLSSLNLTKPDGSTDFDTSQVENMAHMFHNCAALRNLNVSHFTTSSVTDMSYMFSMCSGLTSLDVSRFTTSSVKDMQHMFSVCTELKDLKLSDNFNTSNVTNMDSMFYNDQGFQNIDNILSYFDTSNVENMAHMFQSCTSLDTLNFGDNFNTSKVTNMEAMFFNDINLKEIKLSYFNTSKVENMESMFFGCKELKELNLKNFEMTSTTKSSNMLMNLDALTVLVLGENNNIKNTNITNKGYWVNVGKGTDTEPEASIKWTSAELTNNYDPKKNNDRYVHFDAIVTVHYKDKDSEKDLAPDKLIYGEVNKDYNETAKPIAGYTPTQATITGIYTEKAGEITFFYTKNASQPTPTEVKNVTVHYLDENGNALVPSEILSGKIGDGYISSAKEIAGYTLKTRPTNATGFFSNQPQSVVYIYTKNGSSNSQTPNNNDNQSEKVPTSDNSQSKNNISNKNPRKRPQPVNTDAKNNVVNKTKADPMSTANSNKLPQTGSDKQSTLVVLFFGVLSVLTGLLGSWFNRKKE